MKKYVVVEECSDEMWTSYYDTLDEANEAARGKWGYLTASEKKKNTIQVGWVTPEMVNESLRYDDDEQWWEICGEWDTDDNCLSFGE